MFLETLIFKDFTSDPASHLYHFNNNKKVIGKMKDEKAGVPIVELIVLLFRQRDIVLLHFRQREER